MKDQLTRGMLLISALMMAACGGDDPEALLKEQSDLVCACDNFECGMKVLKGPINQKLKTMKGELSAEGKKQKQRMMKCLMDFKAKEAPGAKGAPAGAPPKPKKFVSAEGRYSAQFPFATKAKVTKDHRGVEWQEVKSTVGMYSVSYADFPSEKAAKDEAAAFEKNMKKSISSARDMKAGDKAGRELVMKVNERATLWLRFVPVGKRLYKLAAGTKNDQKKAYRFLDSIALQ